MSGCSMFIVQCMYIYVGIFVYMSNITIIPERMSLLGEFSFLLTFYVFIGSLSPLFQWLLNKSENINFQKPITRKPHIVPICMPRTDAGDFLDNMGIVTGWGRLEYGEELRLFMYVYITRPHTYLQ